MQTQGKHTVEDVVQWIMSNRQNKVFKDWTLDSVRKRILDAVQNEEMLIDTNNKGEIFGVVIYHKAVYVEHILTTTRFSFRTLILSLFSKFPGFKGYAHRRNGKFKQYKKPLRMAQLTINLT